MAAGGQVALGETHCRPNLSFNMNEDSLPAGKTSIKACGSKAPDPLRDLTLPTGPPSSPPPPPP